MASATGIGEEHIQFMKDFEKGKVAADSFDHESHIRLAWVYLNLFPLAETLQRFSKSLSEFATANGAPDKYHTTITWSYIFLINERLQDAAKTNWETFQQKNPDLFARKLGALNRYYQNDTLHSSLAKTTFLMPDK